MISGCSQITEDDLDELLLGAARPELRAHCDGCVSCKRQVAAFASSLEAFQRASLAWSEARSNTITRDLSGHRPSWHLTAGIARSLVAVFVLGVAAAVAAGTYPWSTHSLGPVLTATARPSAQPFASEARAQEIAQDNAMLEAIDSELTEHEAGAFYQATGISDAQQASREVRD